MYRASFRLFAAMALLGASAAPAADVSGNAMRAVERLATCMKSFDAACANALTYTQMLENHGIPRAELDKRVVDSYGVLQANGAVYTRFELGPARQPFVSTGHAYVIIPYEIELTGRDRRIASQAFFIGVSDDSGKTWKFVDGAQVDQDNVALIIPKYDGSPLPAKSLNQTAVK